LLSGVQAGAAVDAAMADGRTALMLRSGAVARCVCALSCRRAPPWMRYCRSA